MTTKKTSKVREHVEVYCLNTCVYRGIMFVPRVLENIILGVCVTVK